MKHILFAITLLMAISLAACAPAAQPVAAQGIEPTQVTADNAGEEAVVKELVESFGKRLQMVSLLAPNAAQDIQMQYSDFVSPALLETWMNDVSKAPGRMVSSPWPDRIEITSLESESPDRYVVDGFVIEITSTEMVNGGAANKIPVHMVVEREQGHWVITEYVVEH